MNATAYRIYQGPIHYLADLTGKTVVVVGANAGLDLEGV